jgi:uncharacterized membrane protein YphA (DoxX/SURF4 family)
MRPTALQDFAKLLLRLAASLPLGYYGWGWLLGLTDPSGPVAALSVLESRYGFPTYAGVPVIVGLCFASLTLAFGFLTRVAALAGFLAMSGSLFLDSGQLDLAHPETVEKLGLSMTLSAMLLSLACLGAGAASLDAKLFKRKGPP